ncbi:hypothetical protein I7I53_05996 [Histoplasma capsulatum var. duboisii H88]|uniref:Uncharacterized protein n=1 Tax=Ajellomyces capsulatus (strain H88) TaxID=544711 RepID=A0A8A1LB34_AJEC8|nr:hypothetical protein I7I53_05996 [Histoplasma capsulatum var. duboisii H88]
MRIVRVSNRSRFWGRRRYHFSHIAHNYQSSILATEKNQPHEGKGFLPLHQPARSNIPGYAGYTQKPKLHKKMDGILRDAR